MLSITRRDAVKGAAFAAGLVLCGGALGLTKGDGLLRPPGGQDEARFLAQCLRCDRCRSVCPTGCISVARIEDGIIDARTPKIDFRKGYCDFCGLCLDVCPTTALVSFDEKEEEIGTAVVDEAECLAYRATGCTVCFEKCPYDAVSLSASNYPVVDAARCNGCGACENACPSASFGSYSGSSNRGINVWAVGRIPA